MSKFLKNLQRWNKEVFGNIFARKKRLIRKLDSLNRRMGYGYFRYLVDLM